MSPCKILGTMTVINVREVDRSPVHKFMRDYIEYWECCPLTSLSNMYKLVEMMDGDNDPSWWSFQVWRVYRTVTHLPTSQKGFQREFDFVYYDRDWGIPTVWLESEPRSELNFRVPDLNDEEEAAAYYMQIESKIVNGVKNLLPAIGYPSAIYSRTNTFCLPWV